jgi:predicted Zn-dependent protease
MQEREIRAMTLLKSLPLALLLFAAAASGTDMLDLPDIGDSTGSILAPEFERRLGQAFLNHVRRHANIIEDPEVETYIRSIGYRLVAHSDNNTQGFTFFVINDPTINAFAAPGGIVGINSGVILNSDSESELAGVMAHEIAHVTQKHIARSVEMQQRMSLPMMAAMLGAILIATQNPEAGKAAIMAVQGGMAQAGINFTRHNEEEADRIGIQLLHRAGFDPLGMPQFFEKLHRNSRYTAQAPEFLRTHPLTVNRISDTIARAQAIPRRDEYELSRMYHFIRAKLTVKVHRNPHEAVRHFRNEMAKTENLDLDGVNRYGLALALTEIADYEEARGHLRTLLEADPENVSFLLAIADVEVRQGRNAEAFRYYEKAVTLYPDYRPVVLNYSRALLLAGQPATARDVLKKFGRFSEPDIAFYEYLTRAEAESGNAVESGIANAEYYYLTGETRVAIERLKYILRNERPPPDYYQQERILARLDFFEQELRIEKDMKLVQ